MIVVADEILEFLSAYPTDVHVLLALHCRFTDRLQHLLMAMIVSLQSLLGQETRRTESTGEDCHHVLGPLIPSIHPVQQIRQAIRHFIVTGDAKTHWFLPHVGAVQLTEILRIRVTAVHLGQVGEHGHWFAGVEWTVATLDGMCPLLDGLQLDSAEILVLQQYDDWTTDEGIYFFLAFW